MKIGYKATNNFTCKSLTYVVGKEYKMDSMKMCSHGFHYCDKLEDTLDYYAYNKNIVFLKIEVLGNVETKGNKSVTDHMKVLGVVDKKELKNYKFDSNGNKIYYKCFTGDEWFWEYDSNGNKIYYKDCHGGEWFWEYDSNGNKIYQKDWHGNEWFWEYDSNGNKIYEKDCDGRELFYKYDSNGNKIYEKDCYGDEWFWEYKYDSNGNKIY